MSANEMVPSTRPQFSKSHRKIMWWRYPFRLGRTGYTPYVSPYDLHAGIDTFMSVSPAPKARLRALRYAGTYKVSSHLLPSRASEPTPYDHEAYHQT